MHHRLMPKKHQFNYEVFMFYVDLDELDLLSKRFILFSKNKFNFFSFRDKEHLQLPIDNPTKNKTTKEHIIDYLAQNNIEYDGGRIMLLTNMNVLGYNFNPVSFYYYFDKNEKPICAIAEVSNTFREMKPFLFTSNEFKNEVFHLNTTKYFYVSPFIDHDTQFDFSLKIPNNKLNIKIDDYKNGERFFISTLTGVKKEFSNINLLKYAIRFPLIPLRIMFLIHWHALLLWMKKLPLHRKSDFPHLQQNVFNKYKK